MVLVLGLSALSLIVLMSIATIFMEEIGERKFLIIFSVFKVLYSVVLILLFVDFVMLNVK